MDQNTLLHDAAKIGSIEEVEKLLKQGADVNAKDKDGYTPLHFAILWEHKDIVICLLEAEDINVNVQDKKGKTALHIAVIKDVFIHITKAIVKTIKDKELLKTVLHLKGENLFNDMFQEFKYKQFLEKVFQYQESENTNAILNAIKDKDLLKKILQAKDSLNKRAVDYLSKDSDTSIILLFKKKFKEADIKKYFPKEIEGNANFETQTAAQKNVQKKYEGNLLNLDDPKLSDADFNKLIKYLRYVRDDATEYKSDNKFENTRLHYAAKIGSMKLFHHLLANGAKIDVKNKYGYTPLHLAVQNCNTDIVKFSLIKGANINARDSYGMTPAARAAFNSGSVEIIKHLESEGAKLDAKENHGMTLLHFAAQEGHKAVAEYLMLNKKELKIDIDEKDDSGMTPLCAAAPSGHVEIMRLLFTNGANINGGSGRTPLHYAVCQCSDKSLKAVKFLIERGADIKALGKGDRTPAHSAITSSDDTEIMKILMKNINIDAKDEHGLTYLHYAAFYGRLETVKTLLDNNANVNETDNNGLTPLDLASANKSKEIVELLKRKGGTKHRGEIDHTLEYYHYLHRIKLMCEVIHRYNQPDRVKWLGTNTNKKSIERPIKTSDDGDSDQSSRGEKKMGQDVNISQNLNTKTEAQNNAQETEVNTKAEVQNNVQEREVKTLPEARNDNQERSEISKKFYNYINGTGEQNRNLDNKTRFKKLKRSLIKLLKRII